MTTTKEENENQYDDDSHPALKMLDQLVELCNEHGLPCAVAIGLDTDDGDKIRVATGTNIKAVACDEYANFMSHMFTAPEPVATFGMVNTSNAMDTYISKILEGMFNADVEEQANAQSDETH